MLESYLREWIFVPVEWCDGCSLIKQSFIFQGQNTGKETSSEWNCLEYSGQWRGQVIGRPLAVTSPSHCLKPCRNGLYGFSSVRNSLDLCQEKDNESLLQVGSLYYFKVFGSWWSWFIKNLSQVSNPPGAVSSLALYRVDTSASPCLLTGNGHVSTSESRVASRYTCNQHQHKYFAEQGTQTVKTFNRSHQTRQIVKQ